MNIRTTLLTALIALILGLGGTAFTAGATETTGGEAVDAESSTTSERVGWDDEEDGDDDWEDDFDDDWEDDAGDDDW